MKTKTIDITTLEWFDKANGNTYFSSKVTINFGMKTEKTICVPMQYGYGSQHEHTAHQKLIELNYMDKANDRTCLSYSCQLEKILLRVNKRPALLRELKALVKEG